MRKQQYERKENHRRRNRKGSAQKHVMVGLLTLLLILTCSFAFGNSFSSAHGNAQEDPVDFKYYKSVRIEKGDSLWSIAETYRAQEYDSTADYMEELLAVNQMDVNTMDQLQEGDYITISYSDTEYR